MKQCPRLLATAALICLFATTPVSWAADFAVFGGSGGAGGSFQGTAAETPAGGDGSQLTPSIDGRGGDSGSWGGGGGGEGGYIDGADSSGGDAGKSSNASVQKGGDGGGASGGAGGLGTAGNPGNDGSGLSGGGGGAYKDVSGTGGAGGNGGDIGGGGGGGGLGRNGGSAGTGGTLSRTMLLTEYSTVSVEGGHGGGGGVAGFNLSGGHGGHAAGAAVTTGQWLVVTGDLRILAGDGGKGGDCADSSHFSRVGGTGGDGGDAVLNGEGKSVTVGGVFSLTSGNNGAEGLRIYTGGSTSVAPGQGGSGGSAEFRAATLSAPRIELLKNDGDLAFTVESLEIGQNTLFTMDKGTAAGGAFTVTVKGLSFSNGGGLEVEALNGALFDTFGGEISVKGHGNSLNSTLLFDSSGAGKTIAFDLSDLAAGQTALAVNSSVSAAGLKVDQNTAVSLTGASDIDLGQRATLLGGKWEGTFDPSRLGEKTVDEGAGLSKTYLLTASTDELSVFAKKITSTGDYTLPGSYTVAAGVGADESVEMNIAGRLTVGGRLSVSGNAANGARVTAGTLSATELYLTGMNASADLTRLDMNTNGTTLSADAGNRISIVTAELSNGNALVINNLGDTIDIGTLTVSGAGNSLEAATSRRSIASLNAAGAELTFVLPASAGDGDTLVSVTNANVAGTTIGVEAKTALTLSEGQTVTLLAASDSIAGAIANKTASDSYRNVYNISQAGNYITATVGELVSFQEIIGDMFNEAGVNNANLSSGGAYLDWLSEPGRLNNPALARKIEAAFNSAADLASPKAASYAMQQLFGGYAAYANQSLTIEADLFRSRWNARNRRHIDSGIFAVNDTFESTHRFDSKVDMTAAASAGSPELSGQSRIWADVIGSWARQDSKDNLPGYKYSSHGLALGYEYAHEGLNLGLAAAFSRGEMKVDRLGYKGDSDVLNLALYAAYVHQSGLYAEGGLGYGHARNDYNVNMIAPGGIKKGKYGSDSFSADLELGYIARLPYGFNLVPSLGLQYTYLKNNGWKENSSGNDPLIANRFDSYRDHSVNIPAGLRLNKLFRLKNGGFIKPEIRAAYIHAANKPGPSIKAGFVGAPGNATMEGIDPGRHRGRFGLGLNGRLNQKVDFSLDYDFETRSGYKNHNLNAMIGISF